jgi:hypothetical protein
MHARDVCLLNQYSMANQSSYMSQSPIHALSILHIFVKLFHPLYQFFNQAINFKMIMKSNPMVNQNLLTQLLKFSSKFCALISNYFY